MDGSVPPKNGRILPSWQGAATLPHSKNHSSESLVALCGSTGTLVVFPPPSPLWTLFSRAASIIMRQKCIYKPFRTQTSSPQSGLWISILVRQFYGDRMVPGTTLLPEKYKWHVTASVGYAHMSCASTIIWCAVAVQGGSCQLYMTCLLIYKYKENMYWQTFLSQYHRNIMPFNARLWTASITCRNSNQMPCAGSWARCFL